MDSVAKSLLDGGQTDCPLRDNEKLPVKISGVVSGFELTLDVRIIRRKVRKELVMRYCQKPIASLGHQFETP